MHVIIFMLFLTLVVLIFFHRKYKNIFTFHICFQHWDITGYWYSLSNKTRISKLYKSLSLLLMIWRHKEPGHEQKLYWPILPGIILSQGHRGWCAQYDHKGRIATCVWYPSLVVNLDLIFRRNIFINTRSYSVWVGWYYRHVYIYVYH